MQLPGTKEAFCMRVLDRVSNQHLFHADSDLDTGFGIFVDPDPGFKILGDSDPGLNLFLCE